MTNKVKLVNNVYTSRHLSLYELSSPSSLCHTLQHPKKDTTDQDELNHTTNSIKS